jgi:hypothetical protein
MGEERTSLRIFCIYLLYLSSIKVAEYVLETLNEFYETQPHKSFMFHSNNFTINEEAMLLTVDEILSALKDGKWHNLAEITQEWLSPKSGSRIEIALSFLREYSFIQVNEDKQKTKLHPLTLEFIEKIQTLEEEEALDHEGF